MLDTSCGMQDLHVGSNSLTRDRTQALCTGIAEVLTTGPPGSLPHPDSGMCCSPRRTSCLILTHHLRLSTGTANTRGPFWLTDLMQSLKPHLCSPAVIPNADFHLCMNHMMITLIFNICLFS